MLPLPHLDFFQGQVSKGRVNVSRERAELARVTRDVFEGNLLFPLMGLLQFYS